MLRRTLRAFLSACALATPALAQVGIEPINYASARDVDATDGTQSLELSAIAAGDFDDDGDVDLVVSSTNFDLDGAPVILLENDGDARFSIGTELDVRTRPGSIAVEDFDDDGNLDLAIALTGSDEVAVLLGVGGGQFLNAVRFATGDSPVHIAAGDLNGDGLIDLVTANEEDDSLSVLLNAGDGSFLDEVNVNVRILDGGPGRSEPNAVVIGDFDGDGLGDIAATLGARDQVVILLNDGISEFNTITLLVDVGDVPSGIAAGDVDGDDVLDLVAVNSIGDSLHVLIGDGAGEFAAGDAIDTGNGATDVALADLDGDGDLDIATANREGDNVSTHEGDGEGGFAPADDFDTSSGPVSLAVADFDGDGRLDIATANNESSVTLDADVSVLLARSLDDIDDVIGDCGMACGPLGMAPLMFTMLGIAGMKAGVRGSARRR